MLYGNRESERFAGLTDGDLAFLIGETAPDARDPARLVRLVREDEQFRQALVGDDRVFRQVVEDEEILVKISPALYFEVLLRRAAKDMETATHTLERDGSQSIPVFDTDEVVELLSLPGVLLYLSQMLASFTRISSQVTSVRVRRGIRRRVRHNDLDIDSLMGRLGSAGEGQRFGLYRRIADVCLFLSGVFPAYAQADNRYPSGALRPAVTGRTRRSPEDYEREGRRFYGLASEHPLARSLRLSGVLGTLRMRFNSARKPLEFIAANYMR